MIKYFVFMLLSCLALQSNAKESTTPYRNPFLSRHEYQKLTAEQKAIYIKGVRQYLVELSEKLPDMPNGGRLFSLQDLLLGEDAWAYEPVEKDKAPSDPYFAMIFDLKKKQEIVDQLMADTTKLQKEFDDLNNQARQARDGATGKSADEQRASLKEASNLSDKANDDNTKLQANKKKLNELQNQIDDLAAKIDKQKPDKLNQINEEIELLQKANKPSDASAGTSNQAASDDITKKIHKLKIQQARLTGELSANTSDDVKTPICIYAGFTIYGEKCIRISNINSDIPEHLPKVVFGIEGVDPKDIKCPTKGVKGQSQEDSVLCNPFSFGLTDDKKPICIHPQRSATKKCDEIANKNKKSILWAIQLRDANQAQSEDYEQSLNYLCSPTGLENNSMLTKNASRAQDVVETCAAAQAHATNYFLASKIGMKAQDFINTVKQVTHPDRKEKKQDAAQ